MTEVETERFTVGVFQDAEWAARGVEALRRHGFEPESLNVLARDTPEAASLIRETFGQEGERLVIRDQETVVAHGPLVAALQGLRRDLDRLGIAATMSRVGFQAHDGFIFDTLMRRGGVLVAVQDEPRAADALAVLHAYGGGNAAIGAWRGRV